MLKRLPFFILLLSLLCDLRVQAISVPDTLAKRLASMPEDTNKVLHLNSLLRQYINQDPGLAKQFGVNALLLSEKLEYKKGKALSNMYIGIVYKNQSDYPKALTHFRDALVLYQELEDQEGIGKCSNNIGNVFREQGNHEEALQYYLKSLQIFEGLKNKEQISILYNNIALVNYELANIEKSLEYHYKSLEIKKALNDVPGISASYNNLGIIFKKQKNFDKALEMYMNSLRLDEQANDRTGIAISLKNIADIYQEQKKNEEALQTYFKALEVSKSIDFTDGMALSMIGIGEVYNEQDQFSKAISFFSKALVISEKAQIRSRVKDCYSGLATAHSGLGDYKKAFEYFNQFSLIKDTILNEETTSIITRMQESYNTEKKDRHIELLEKNKQLQETEIKRKSTIIYSLYAGITLVLILGFLIYTGFRQKQKANLALQAAYKQIEEKNKDITDSINYAKKIQTAILPEKERFFSVFPDSFILYKPKDIVSGDFYYFTETAEGYVVAAADCTGHGVPGAFMSMIGNDLLNHIILEKKIFAPSEILNLLNEGIRNALKQDAEEEADVLNIRDGMDIAVCSINKNKDRLMFAGAHRPLFLISEGKAIEVRPDKISIGGARAGVVQTFSQHEIPLKKGDRFYLYSDGYVDQFGGPQGKKFMSKRFKALIEQVASKPMQEQEVEFDKALVEWMGEQHKQVDDVLVIGARV